MYLDSFLFVCFGAPCEISVLPYLSGASERNAQWLNLLSLHTLLEVLY